MLSPNVGRTMGMGEGPPCRIFTVGASSVLKEHSRDQVSIAEGPLGHWTKETGGQEEGLPPESTPAPETAGERGCRATWASTLKDTGVQ